ncbi:MAG: ribonuclease PH [Proteobacteria bacterium]|jgi:ribonuclease PH|nr:ribonuclease PH [Pseudomonadota bacterium]
MRAHNRTKEQLRNVSFETHYIDHPEGSCLIKMGRTWVLCTASIEEKVPPFLFGKSQGWITAEYSMLPRATHSRTQRESVKGKQSGRTQEIQRLIGRSLRACVDLKKLGERSITIDCDVLQADGGTRIASINGGFVALSLAIKNLLKNKKLKEDPIISPVSAVSVGMKDGEVLVDLDYVEDSGCEVDMNIVMLGTDKLIEVQGTGENGTFTFPQMTAMMEMAKVSAGFIGDLQKKAIDAA